MTDQEINVAIAEACIGFTPCKDCGGVGWTQEHGPDGEPMQAGCQTCNGSGSLGDCPDYCNDLNAMAQAQDTLMDGQLIGYVDQLLCLINEVDSGYYHRLEWAHGADLITSTARQRAEAFLRALGKWKE